MSPASENRADPGLGQEILGRLQQGASLDGLGLARLDGRWDLRGLTVAPPSTIDRSTVRLAGGGPHEIERVQGVTTIRRVELADLDLSDARLASVIFEQCLVRNCVFDGAELDDARFFGCSVSGSSFRRASLRDSLLGGTEGRRRPSFDHVDFSAARLDRADPGSAAFTDCTFQSARLKGMEFYNARLTRCEFAGKVDHVTFSGRHTRLGLFGHEETLIDVDFSRATFEWVELRGLNLDRVTLPTSPGHIVVRRPRCVIEHVLAELRTEAHPDADQRGFRAVLELSLERLGPAQSQAVFTIRDLVKSDAARQRAAAMIGAASSACGPS